MMLICVYMPHVFIFSSAKRSRRQNFSQHTGIFLVQFCFKQYACDDYIHVHTCMLVSAFSNTSHSTVSFSLPACCNYWSLQILFANHCLFRDYHCTPRNKICIWWINEKIWKLVLLTTCCYITGLQNYFNLRNLLNMQIPGISYRDCGSVQLKDGPEILIFKQHCWFWRWS